VLCVLGSNRFGEHLNLALLKLIFLFELNVALVGAITTPSRKQYVLQVFNFYLVLKGSKNYNGG